MDLNHRKALGTLETLWGMTAPIVKELQVRRREENEKGGVREGGGEQENKKEGEYKIKRIEEAERRRARGMREGTRKIREG